MQQVLVPPDTKLVLDELGALCASASSAFSCKFLLRILSLYLLVCLLLLFVLHLDAVSLFVRLFSTCPLPWRATKIFWSVIAGNQLEEIISSSDRKHEARTAGNGKVILIPRQELRSQGRQDMMDGASFKWGGGFGFVISRPNRHFDRKRSLFNMGSCVLPKSHQAKLLFIRSIKFGPRVQSPFVSADGLRWHAWVAVRSAWLPGCLTTWQQARAK